MLFLPEINDDNEIILSEEDIREANRAMAEAVLFDDLIKIHESSLVKTNQT